MTDTFWAELGAQTAELLKATSAKDVLATLAQSRNPYGPGCSTAEGFYAGEGDETWEALIAAGWCTVWINAGYWWCMAAPDGSMVTYIEGDVYEGNRKP